MRSFESPFIVGSEAAWRFYERMDEARHLQRGMLDALGRGPQVRLLTVVLRGPGVMLKAYQDPSRPGSVNLMVTAPTKRLHLGPCPRRKRDRAVPKARRPSVPRAMGGDPAELRLR